MASQTQAAVLTGMTSSGYTAYGLSRHRPKTDIVIFTGNHKLLNQMALAWGVRGLYYDRMADMDETVADVQKALKDKKYAKTGDVMISTSRMPLKSDHRTNTIRLSEIE